MITCSVQGILGRSRTPLSRSGGNIGAILLIFPLDYGSLEAIDPMASLPFLSQLGDLRTLL